MTSRFYTLLTPENFCHERANLKHGLQEKFWKIYPSATPPASGSLKKSLNILTSKFHTSAKPAMWKQYANALFLNVEQQKKAGEGSNMFPAILLLNLFHSVHVFAFLQCAGCCKYLITRRAIKHPRVQLDNYERG